MSWFSDEYESVLSSNHTTSDDRPNLILESLSNYVYHGKSKQQEFMDLLFSEQGRKELCRLDERGLNRLWIIILEQSDHFSVESNIQDVVIERLLDIDHTKHGLTCDHLGCFFVSSMKGVSVSSNLFTRMIAAATNTTIMTIHTSTNDENRNDDGLLLEDINEDAMRLMHIAAEVSTPLEVFQRLYELIPQCVSYQDKYLQLPLHVAIDNLTFCVDPFSRIQTLLQFNPYAARVKDHNGFVPFHLLLLHGMNGLPQKESSRLLHLLYDAYPMAVKTRLYSTHHAKKHSTFEYPLHYLCRHVAQFSTNKGLILFLIEKFPKGLFLEDGFKMTPLHAIPALSEGITSMLNEIDQSTNLTDVTSRLHDQRNGNNILHVLSKRIFFVAAAGITINKEESEKCFHLSTARYVLNWAVSKFPHLLLEKNHDGFCRYTFC